MAATPDVSEGTLGGERLESAVQIAVRAFDDDPFFQYLFPGEAQRQRSVAMLHRTVLRSVASIGVTRTAYVDGNVAGVAVWVPPGKWPYSPLLQIRQLIGAVAAAAPGFSSLSRARPIMHAVASAHPKRPQWYLQLLMVDPPFQRQGIGMVAQYTTRRLLGNPERAWRPVLGGREDDHTAKVWQQFPFAIAASGRLGN